MIDGPLTIGIERVRTTGVFSLDGQDFEVENNIWLVSHGDDLVIVDAAHDASAIAAAVGGRRVSAIVCTHGHNDHINAALDLADAVSAPIALHPDDRMLWDTVHPGRAPDLELADGDDGAGRAGAPARSSTRRATPRAASACSPRSRACSSAATPSSRADRAPPAARSPTSAPSSRRSAASSSSCRPTTVVHTGHGDDTTIGDEAPHLDEWIARGH